MINRINQIRRIRGNTTDARNVTRVRVDRRHNRFTRVRGAVRPAGAPTASRTSGS